MAGAAHATPDELFFSARPQDIVKAGRAVPPMSCNEGPRSRFPSRIFVDAALRNIDLWSRDGLPAPPGQDIGVENRASPCWTSSATCSTACARPTSTSRRAPGARRRPARRSAASPGYEIPFDQATLDELYPTQGAYVRAVQRSVRELVADRYLTRADGQAIIREAEALNVTGGGEE